MAETVYALYSATIDLCLSVFPWAEFRRRKAAIKLHTLLDLRGNIPRFIHVSKGKLHDVNVLDTLPLEPPPDRAGRSLLGNPTVPPAAGLGKYIIAQ